MKSLNHLNNDDDDDDNDEYKPHFQALDFNVINLRKLMCIPTISNYKHQSTAQIGTKTLQLVKENGIMYRHYTLCRILTTSQNIVVSVMVM